MSMLAWELTYTNSTAVYAPLLGLNLKIDQPRAYRLAMTAAQNDDALANVLLFRFHEFGLTGVVEINQEKADKYCNKAIEANFALAMVEKSMKLHKLTHPKIHPDVTSLAIRASELGDPIAHHWIGALYADGVIDYKLDINKHSDPKGKLVHEHLAIYHYILAVRLGDASAKKQLELFAKEIQGDPNILYWSFFKRDYPNLVKDFYNFTNK